MTIYSSSQPPIHTWKIEMSSNTTLDATIMLPSISCKLKFFDNSFFIFCKNDYIGNPYEICTEENDKERDDLCQTQECGPNAVCNLGKKF